MFFLDCTVARSALLLLIAAVVLAPAATRADPLLRSTIDIDVAGARRSALGDEATLAYATVLGLLEGSTSELASPAITIDRLRCAFSSNEYTCDLYGRFAPSALATIRSVDPSSTQETASLTSALPHAAGSDWRAALRVCSGSHWIVSSAPASRAACELPAEPQNAHAVDWVASMRVEANAFDFEMPTVTSIRADFHLRALDEEQVLLNLDDVVEARVTLAFDDVAGARSFRERLSTGGDLGVLSRAGFRVLDVVAGESGVELSIRIGAPPLALERAASSYFLELLFGPSAPSDPDAAALEPMAELEDFRDQVAHNLSSMGFYPAIGAETTMPVIVLSSSDYELDGEILTDALALVRGARPRVFFLFGDGGAATTARVWTTRGEAALSDVRARVAALAAGVDPCVRGCVLVAAVTVADLAVELASLDPARFPSVLLRDARRADTLPFLEDVRRLPDGVTFTLFETDVSDDILDADDGTDALFAAFKRIRPHLGEQVLRGEARSFARATRVSIDATGSVRAGRIEQRARARMSTFDTRSRRCREGDARACFDLTVVGVDGDSLRSGLEPSVWLALDRSCALGYSEACYYVARRFPRDDIAYAASLEFACERGHARACADLGGIFELGRLLVRDRATALSYFDRSCALDASGVCAHATRLRSNEGAR